MRATRCFHTYLVIPQINSYYTPKKVFFPKIKTLFFLGWKTRIRFFLILCCYWTKKTKIITSMRSSLSSMKLLPRLSRSNRISILVHSSRNKSCTILNFFLYFVIATTHTIGSVSCVNWLEIRRYIACKKISSQFLSLSLLFELHFRQLSSLWSSVVAYY